jgi:hypothetical protein
LAVVGLLRPMPESIRWLSEAEAKSYQKTGFVFAQPTVFLLRFFAQLTVFPLRFFKRAWRL